MYPQSPALFEAAISKPRLDSYKGYFRANIEESVGLYMWNCELTACMGTMLALFEIALRNSIHRELTHYVSLNPTNTKHWYDHLPFNRNTLEKVRKVREKMHPIVPSPDEIVSRVTFGFWPAVLGAIPQGRGVPLYQKMFPHHPLSLLPAGTDGWAPTTDRKRALAFVYELNDFRNRIAHHEPLWKFPPVDDKLVNPRVRIYPDSTSEAESLVRLKRIIGFVDAAIHAIEPGLQADMAAASWRRKLNFLLTPRGIVRYRMMKHAPKAITASPTEFRRSFSLLVKANQPVFVKRSFASGIFIPD